MCQTERKPSPDLCYALQLPRATFKGLLPGAYLAADRPIRVFRSIPRLGVARVHTNLGWWWRRCGEARDAGIRSTRARSIFHGGTSEHLLVLPRVLIGADLAVCGWRCESNIDKAVGPVDIERMTGLPIAQLLDVTVCGVPLLAPEQVAAWTTLDPGSVVVTTLYLRQTATEDFVAAIFDVSQATVSRRRAVLEQPVATALAAPDVRH